MSTYTGCLALFRPVYCSFCVVPAAALVGPQVWSAHDLASLQLTEGGQVRAEDVGVAGAALLALRDRLPALLLAAQHAWHVAALNGTTGAALVESAMSSALAPAPSTSTASVEPFQAQGTRLCTQPYSLSWPV